MTDTEGSREDWKAGKEVEPEQKAKLDEIARLTAAGMKMSPAAPHTVDQIAQDVCMLNRLAVARRAHRFETGSLSLNNVKLNFKLDEERVHPLDWGTYPIKDSNKLVEEFMLLANMVVAEQLAVMVPELALLRNHPEPSATGMDKLNQLMTEMGVSFDSSSAGALHDTLQQYEDKKLGEGPASAILQHLR